MRCPLRRPRPTVFSKEPDLRVPWPVAAPGVVRTPGSVQVQGGLDGCSARIVHFCRNAKTAILRIPSDGGIFSTANMGANDSLCRQIPGTQNPGFIRRPWNFVESIYGTTTSNNGGWVSGVWGSYLHHFYYYYYVLQLKISISAFQQ